MKISDVMKGFREDFLTTIFKNYPDHQKTWKAEEIEKAFSSSMYNMALFYLDKINRDEENKNKEIFREMSLENDKLREENEYLKDKLKEAKNE